LLSIGGWRRESTRRYYVQTFVETGCRILNFEHYLTDIHIHRAMDGGGINELLTAAHMIESTTASHRIKSKKSTICDGGSCPTTIASHKRCVNIHSRTAHNELEKTRRANLRSCLDRLKDMVPTGGGSDTTSPRNTTLSLLTRARNYIQTLENTNQAIIAEKRRLQDQQRLMRRHLELLTAARLSTSASSVIVRKRTISESSTSTISANDASDMHSDESLDEHLPIDLHSSSQQASGSSSPNGSTWMLEYSPSTKPTPSTMMLTDNIDPYIEGLLPALPLFHPPLSVYPYFGVKCAHDSPTTFVLIGGHHHQLGAFYPSTY